MLYPCALPAGHLQDFLRLLPWISTSAQRQATRLAGTDDLTAALFLHEEEQKRRTRLIEEKASAEQFLAAAGAPPSKYKSRLHFARFQRPTARKNSEESERQRWIQLLANLIIGTDTPMGKLLRARQGDIAVLGVGVGLSHCEQNTFTRHIFSYLHALTTVSNTTLAQDGCPHHVIHVSCAVFVLTSLRLSTLHSSPSLSSSFSFS